MPVTALQKKTAQAIVNIFETGRVLGDYGAVAVIAGDTGRLSYGRTRRRSAAAGFTRCSTITVQARAHKWLSNSGLYCRAFRRRI